METRKRYCFDLDGVLANFHDSFSDLVERECGVTIPRDGDYPAKYNWYEDYTANGGHAWHYIRTHPDWWRTLSPLISAEGVANLRRLSKDGDIIIITARSLCPGYISQQWVEENVGTYPVISVNNWIEKVPLLLELKPLLYMDDHLPTLDKLAAEGITGDLVAADWPFTNRSRFTRMTVDECIRRKARWT